MVWWGYQFTPEEAGLSVSVAVSLRYGSVPGWLHRASGIMARAGAYGTVTARPGRPGGGHSPALSWPADGHGSVTVTRIMPGMQPGAPARRCHTAAQACRSKDPTS
eukprot:748446-Hanusia_phi.AAC.2